MVNETELENRTDLQARYSQPYGHTAFDREDNSAFLMVQMRKDIAVVGSVEPSIMQSLIC
jgi:hypothetical protein